MFYSAMNMTDIVDFTRFAQSNAHGAIHTIIGGVSNVDWKPYFRDMNFTLGEELGLQGFGMVKRLWRSGTLECPTGCSSDTPMEQCSCKCPGYDTWNDDQITLALRNAAGAFENTTWYANHTGWGTKSAEKSNHLTNRRGGQIDR